jgi:hypothetical protein
MEPTREQIDAWVADNYPSISRLSTDQAHALLLKKERVPRALSEEKEASKPIEIRGVRRKDMTPEQNRILGRWSKRNSPKHTWRKNHPEKAKASAQRTRKKHLVAYRKKDAERLRILRATDVEYQLLHSLRKRLMTIMRSKGKTKAARELVGCTLAELKSHLEAQFIGCMSWNNHGTAWHIDHRVPCRYFDLSTEYGRRECFHFSNLRPLWAKTNLSRFKKGVPVQQEIPFSQSMFAIA